MRSFVTLICRGESSQQRAIRKLIYLDKKLQIGEQFTGKYLSQDSSHPPSKPWRIYSFSDNYPPLSQTVLALCYSWNSYCWSFCTTTLYYPIRWLFSACAAIDMKWMWNLVTASVDPPHLRLYTCSLCADRLNPIMTYRLFWFFWTTCISTSHKLNFSIKFYFSPKILSASMHT